MAQQRSRIDVHHHIVPDFYKQILIEHGVDTLKVPVPEWNLTTDDAFSSSIGVGTAIFSLTVPGVDFLGDGEEAAKLARDVNIYIASVRDKNPSRYGFFASTPPLTNPSAAVAEIEYALDVLKADGIVLFTRYGFGPQYLGHPDFKAVWDVLDKKNATVFVHPTVSADNRLPNQFLVTPIVDFPHETTRTALDLIISHTLRTHPNAKVILSHAGGTIPFVIKRAAYALPALTNFTKTPEEVLAEVGLFYYDVALSSTSDIITMLSHVAKPDHILFGSDYPFAPTPLVNTFAGEYDATPLSQEVRDAISWGNALKLFPRLQG